MLKKILITLGVLVIAVVAGVPAYFYTVYPKLRPAPDMKAPDTPEAIARGRYLVEAMTGCRACHSPVDESRPGVFVERDGRLRRECTRQHQQDGRCEPEAPHAM